MMTMVITKEKLRWLALEAQKYNKAFIAMDDDGIWYAYEKRPEYICGRWENGDDLVCLTPVPHNASEQMFNVTQILSDNE